MPYLFGSMPHIYGHQDCIAHDGTLATPYLSLINNLFLASSLSPIEIIPSLWCGEFWHEEKSSPAECMVVYRSSFDFQNAEVASSATERF